MPRRGSAYAAAEMLWLIGIGIAVRVRTRDPAGAWASTSRTWSPMGRKVSLSYFDHPPLAFWLAHGASVLALAASPISVVRLPFVLLFAGTHMADVPARGHRRFRSGRAGGWRHSSSMSSAVFGVSTAELGAPGRAAHVRARGERATVWSGCCSIPRRSGMHGGGGWPPVRARDSPRSRNIRPACSSRVSCSSWWCVRPSAAGCAVRSHTPRWP